MSNKSQITQSIKQNLILEFKQNLINQLGPATNEFNSIDKAITHANQNNINPIIIISKDNSELVLLF